LYLCNVVNKQKDSTELKIKEAARAIFYKKGFAATKSRDIAEKAGTNLALVNYYFRSKQNLFDIVMLESITKFFQGMRLVFNDEGTTLTHKVELFVEAYIDMFKKEPNIPVFVLSEMRTNPDGILSKLDLQEVLMKSFFSQQVKKAMDTEENKGVSPLHFLINIMSLSVFPFVANPMIKQLNKATDKDFHKLMDERKILIPKWIDSMFNLNHK